MTLRRTLPVAVAFAAAAFASGSGATEMAVGDLDDLPQADVYFLGELHDNPDHHQIQAVVIKALGARALVFEMLDEAQALRVRPEMLGNPEQLEEVLGWRDSGWPDFRIYYPIFEAAGEAAFFGGYAPLDQVRQAITDGAAEAFGGSASIFGLDQALDIDEQATREAGQMAAHCDAMPEEMLGGMVEAQRLRDAHLARAVFAAFAETGGPVAVITGNGHARTDWGAPRLLGRIAPDLTSLSVGQFETPPEGDVPFDVWLVSDPVERGDPCEAFK